MPAGLLLGLGLFLWVTARKELAVAILFTAVPMMTAGFIGFAVARRRPVLAVFRSGFLRFFGDISYWVYLIHIFFVYKVFSSLLRREPAFVARGGVALWVVLSVAVLALSVGSGVAVRKWVELPALRRKGRFG